MSYIISEEQKKLLMQISAQTLPDNPSREGYSAETIRKRLYKPTEKLVDLINGIFGTVYTDFEAIKTDIEAGNFKARALVSWSDKYRYGAGEITFYPNIGEFGAFIKSIQENNSQVPYINGVINSSYWEQVVNFDTIADDYFQQIQDQADRAEAAADIAVDSAEKLRDVSSRLVVFVDKLPEIGDPAYIYAVVSDADTNLFDLWAWINGVKTYFGSANIVTDVDTISVHNLLSDGWINNTQVVEIAEVNTNKKVVVMALDTSAEPYIKYGIVPALANGSVIFSCGSVPEVDIGVVVQVTTKNEIKNLAGYYTKPQIDSALALKQNISDSSLQTSDKSVVGAINENKVAIDGLRTDIINEAHFRGAFQTNEEVKTSYGNMNDYAWSLESGTVWIYGSDGWADSGKPIPNQAIAKSTTTPLMDGVAAIGNTNTYADGAHVHPTDVTRASAAAFSEEVANREAADSALNDKIENVYLSVKETLRVENWSNNQQTLNLSNVTAINGVWVYPENLSAADYVVADIYFTQINGGIVFTCSNTPTVNIDIIVDTLN